MFFTFQGFSQNLDFGIIQPQVQLHLIVGFEKSKVIVNSSVKLIIYGQIPDGWHLYSVNPNTALNIIPTSIIYQDHWYQKQTKLQESETQLIFDKALGVKIKAHRKQFRLSQTLLISKDAPVGNLELVGLIQYQICNQQVCLEPQQAKFIAPITVAAK